jgi:3-methylfumaryl-CoA hydratase
MSLLTPEMKSAIGRSLPPVTEEVTRREVRKYAVATGQRLEKYLRGDEAPPMFLYGLFRDILQAERLLPDGRPPDSGLLPDLPLKRVMAGGTEATYHRRIHAGDVLVATQTLVDLFEKEGSQGPLIFAVVEHQVKTKAGEPVMTERVTRIAR